MTIDCLRCSLTVVWQQINRQQITGCVHDACSPNLPWTLPAKERFPGNVMLLSVILRKMVDFHPPYLSHFPNLRTLNGYFTPVIRIVHSWTDAEQVCSGLPTEPLEGQVPDESLRLSVWSRLFLIQVYTVHLNTDAILALVLNTITDLTVTIKVCCDLNIRYNYLRDLVVTEIWLFNYCFS